MDLKLLGPLELVVGDRSLNLGGPRQRVVLSMMALNANRVTSVDRLVEAVWDIAPPSTARSQIQISVSSLRKLFAGAAYPEAIKTRAPGYLLEIANDALDTEVFATLVAQSQAHAEAGRNADAAAALRRALGLWRGPALADIPSDLVQRDAARLEAGHFAAMLARVRLDLAMGRHREITGELAALVGEHPLREELYGFLMLALYRSGRQAEALEVCRRARATLVDDVGIEPGQQLRDLERAILNRDPALEMPKTEGPDRAQSEAARPVQRPVLPRQLPASISDFTDRQSEIAGAVGWLSDPQASSMAPYAVRIVAISGKGGVGKSAMAMRVAHELSAAFPDGHLYADLRATNGQDSTPKVLARFLHALGVSGSAMPEDLQERIDLYRSRLDNKRLLVVLDGVASEEQVSPLLPGSPTCALIVTSRVRLSGLCGAHWVDLDVFGVDESLDLLGKIVGVERIRAERDASVELVHLCGGLPLALRIAGARLAAKPHWPVRRLVQRLGDEARRLDEFAHHGLELRSTIGMAYHGLRKQAQQLFRLLALINAPDFPAWTAAALLDIELAQAEHLLESLVDARLIDTVEDPGTPQLRCHLHDLIRVYARERLLESETADEQDEALARVLSGWLALAGQAHRQSYGGDFTILHGNAPRWLPSDVEATDLIGAPVAWWHVERRALATAIRQAAAAGLDELCWDLALTSVSLFEAKGYFDDWRETSQLAYDAATRAGNRTGRAAMLYSLGTLSVFQKRLDEAADCLNSALELFQTDGNTHGRALVIRNSALIDRLRGRSAVMLAKYAESLEAMRAVGDRIGEAHILCGIAKFRIDEGEFDDAKELLDAALVICQQAGCLRVEAQVRCRFTDLYVGTRQFDLARQSLRRTLLIVREHGDLIGEAYALYGLGVVLQRERELDDAGLALTDALALARRVGERLLEGQALYALAKIAMTSGDDRTAGGRLGEARLIFEELGSAVFHAKTLTLLAEIHHGDGDTVTAMAEVADAERLLASVDSKESQRWRSRLNRIKFVVLSDGADRANETAAATA